MLAIVHANVPPSQKRHVTRILCRGVLGGLEKNGALIYIVYIIADTTNTGLRICVILLASPLCARTHRLYLRCNISRAKTLNLYILYILYI